jgi:hypothetical protein
LVSQSQVQVEPCCWQAVTALAVRPGALLSLPAHGCTTAGHHLSVAWQDRLRHLHANRAPAPQQQRARRHGSRAPPVSSQPLAGQCRQQLPGHEGVESIESCCCNHTTTPAGIITVSSPQSIDTQPHLPLGSVNSAVTDSCQGLVARCSPSRRGPPFQRALARRRRGGPAAARTLSTAPQCWPTSQAGATPRPLAQGRSGSTAAAAARAGFEPRAPSGASGRQLSSVDRPSAAPQLRPTTREWHGSGVPAPHTATTPTTPPKQAQASRPGGCTRQDGSVFG